MEAAYLWPLTMLPDASCQTSRWRVVVVSRPAVGDTQ